MNEWVKSDEAARIIGCSRSYLYIIISKNVHGKNIRRKRIKNTEMGTSGLWYNRFDCAEIAAIRESNADKNGEPSTAMVHDEPRMWHPAMLKPWTRDGLRGVFG